MADVLGTDIGCYPDLDSSGALVSGRTMLAQALARRLTTPRGGLFYDTNYGTDLRLYLNEGMTNEAQSRIKAAVESECLKDERVSACSAEVSFSLQTQLLKVSISVDTKAGPFSLTLAVSSLTVDLLAVT
jgi:phage baseplate assembly protein W